MSHLTIEDVIKFVSILKKRIKDIEEVIDKHFSMIHDAIIQDVKDIFDNQRKERIRTGVTLTLP